MTDLNPTGQPEKPIDPREDQLLDALLERAVGDFREQDNSRVKRLIDTIRQARNPASGKNEVEIGTIFVIEMKKLRRNTYFQGCTSLHVGLAAQ